MAKHKAPTQVTIAPTEEQSAFASGVERLWKPFAAIAAVAVALILYVEFKTDKERSASFESWDGLVTAMGGVDLFSGQWEGDGAAIDAASKELADTTAGPWGMYLAAVTFGREKNFDEAVAVLKDLKSKYPDHGLNQDRFEFEGSDAPLTLPENLERVLSSLGTWTSSHPEVFENPSPPADAPRVRINTESGSIVVVLYTDRAPKHCENFLKLCGEGFYDGTRFHRVLANVMIQGGDPESKDEANKPAWGTGGPGYKIDPEDSELYHFEGVLAAAKQGGDTESSGSQFYITTGAAHGFDDRYVVYGAVVEGLDVAKKIGEGEIEPPDRPAVPIKVTSTEVL